MSDSKKTIKLSESSYAVVEKDEYNPLIKRRKIILKIYHPNEGTPMRVMLRMTMAEAFGVDMERLYIRNIFTEYGKGESTAIVHIYDNVERALQFEPKFVIERNGGVKGFEE